MTDQPQSQPLYTAEFGIQPYSFRHSFPHGVAETLDTIKDMGFTQIEGKWMDIDPMEYLQLCRERGLSIPSMAAGYERLVDSTEKVIEEATIYGSKYVMCAWIPHEVGKFSLQDMDKAIADFNRVGKVLHEHGLRLSYHTHGYEMKPYKEGTEEGTLLDYMMAQTDPRYVTFQMDIFWVHFGGGDPVALLKQYADRWKMLHVKDMRHGIEKNLTGQTDPQNDVTLGTGQVDVEGVLRTAKEIGIEYYFIEDESDRIITQIPASIEYMKSLTVGD